MPTETNPTPVLFSTLACTGGRALGLARLNCAASLNALTLPMIRALDTQLAAWALDPHIVCVLLSGAGEKAFCAGGDVRALRSMLIAQPHPSPHPAITTFFAEEYALDYRIHNYAKPLLVWGQGIVMGGGLGLLAGASHRVFTRQSQIAMPEISIGLYPDVGASWFLARMPAQLGAFLALTGAPISAGDALLANLGDFVLEPEQWKPLLEALTRSAWPQDPKQHHAHLNALLSQIQPDTAAPSLALAHLKTIQRIMQQGDFATVAAALASARFQHPWLIQAQQNFVQGCPTSQALSWEIQQRTRRWSLAEVLRLELVLSVNLCAHPDFCEGVRALLVDKDRQPNWSLTASQINQADLDRFFQSPWRRAAHPLAHLASHTP